MVEVHHPGAAAVGPITDECAVGHDGIAAKLVGHPAAGVSCISDEVAVCHRRATGAVMHPAAIACLVAAEVAVCHRRVAASVVAHPAAAVGARITAEDAIGDRRAAAQIVHSATTAGFAACAATAGDGKSLQFCIDSFAALAGYDR